MKIDWQGVIDGWVAFLGPYKVAVLNTKHHQGLVRNGALVWEPMDRSLWTIHFTSPAMKIEVLETVVGSIPKEA